MINLFIVILNDVVYPKEIVSYFFSSFLHSSGAKSSNHCPSMSDQNGQPI